MRRIILGGAIAALGIALALAIFWGRAEDDAEQPVASVQESLEPVHVATGLVDSEKDSEDVPSDEGASPLLEGVVVDPLGQPIENAEVSVWLGTGVQDQNGKEESQWTSDPLFSDEEGAFSVRVPKSDVAHFVDVRKDTYEYARRKIKTPPEGIRGVRVVLYPQCSISGNVFSDDGRPLANVIVAANSGLNDPSQVSNARVKLSKPSGEDGSFEVHGLARGYCHLYTTEALLGADGNPTGLTTFQTTGSLGSDPLLTLELAQGEQRAGVVVRLAPVETEQFVEGYVVSQDNQPISGASVWVTAGPEGNRSLPKHVTPSDREGHFLVQGEKVAPPGTRVRTGPVYVHVAHNDFERAYVPDVRWNTEDLVISMVPKARGLITGIVLERRSRRPVEQALVNIWQIDTQWGDRIRPDLMDLLNLDESKTIQTNTEGRFQLADVPAGRVALQITHPDYGVSVHRPKADVASGENTDVEILLDEPGTLDVRVVSLAQPERGQFKSHIDLVPLDIVSEQDLLPSRLTYGNIDGRAPSAMGETCIGETFFQVNMQKSGVEVWRSVAGSEFRGAMTLPPGDYRVASRSYWKSAGEQRQCTFYASKRVAVRSGKTTTALFEIGGGAVVRILSSVGQEQTRRLILVMATPDQISKLDGHDFPSRTSVRNAIQGFLDGAYFFDAPVREMFEFDNVLKGSYVLRAYGFDEAEDGVNLLAEKELNVEGGMEYEVALP